jgi:hypothetical protein
MWAPVIPFINASGILLLVSNNNLRKEKRKFPGNG